VDIRWWFKSFCAFFQLRKLPFGTAQIHLERQLLHTTKALLLTGADQMDGWRCADQFISSPSNFSLSFPYLVGWSIYGSVRLSTAVTAVIWCDVAIDCRRWICHSVACCCPELQDVLVNVAEPPIPARLLTEVSGATVLWRSVN